MSIYYGKAAYEGFARAIGRQLGLSVKVDAGASACIDAGGTIHLPGMDTFQTAAEFEATCGTIVHELAHQFYESHSLIDPNRSRLEHDCLNAVLDVADETWVDAYFQRYIVNARPGQLLTRSALHSLLKHWNAYKDWQANTHAWKVLCVGIFSARVDRSDSYMRRNVNRLAKYTRRQAAAHNVDADACFRLLRSARLLKRQDAIPTRKRFAKLLKLARKLAALLATFAPPPGSTSPAVGAVMPIGEATAAGAKQLPPGALLASESEGEGEATAPVASPQGGNGSGAGNGSVNASSTAFALLAPSIRRVADRIATDGDAPARVDGMATGPLLAHAHRLLTDGHALARWQDDRADGVSIAVLLDCSDSMTRDLPECAGIARAFAQCMRQAGDVRSYCFGDDVADASDDFQQVRTMGGTATHLALADATAWLATRAGTRWIVLITDGAPYNRARTDAAATRATAQGVRILSVGLRCSIALAGAKSVTAPDAVRLAIQLDAAARSIEAA